MEPMFMAFQNDVNTYDNGVDFMWGDSLLVANVVEENAKSRNVYLPVNIDDRIRFYDFYTREEHETGQTIEIPVDISSIPLFVKSGAIIPMASHPIYNLMNETVNGLHIIMAPDIDSEFTMYDDDGKTNDYLQGDYLKTDIKVTSGSRTYIDFAYEGTYKTHVKTMELDVIHREKAPYYVQLDGVEMIHFLHRRKYEEAESGWYYSQTLKSVLIKYPNPEKNHQVMISFEVFDMIGM